MQYRDSAPRISRQPFSATFGKALSTPHHLVEGISLCESSGDYVSREILLDILKDTEDHIDYLSTQIGLLEAMGEPNYLQSAAGPLPD